MILIDRLDELKGESGLFSARVLLSEKQREPETYRMLVVTYGLSFEEDEAWLSQPIQEIVLSHHISRPDIAARLKEPTCSPWEDLLGEPSPAVFDPDNFYPPTTAPDKLRLRIVQVLDETRDALGSYPHELLKIEKMIGREEERQFLYAYGGAERFCKREKKALIEKGYALDEACQNVY